VTGKHKDDDPDELEPAVPMPADRVTTATAPHEDETPSTAKTVDAS
jgi:hypothetical protein